MAIFTISPELYVWVVLPAAIFFARICDVSMETIRVVYISKGIKVLSAVIAFFEISIWLLAMEVVLSNLSNIATFLAYAFGFACGTYIGLLIEERLSIGRVVVRVITAKTGSDELIDALSQAGCGVTTVDAAGARNRVKLILTLVDRHDLPELLRVIDRFDPHAFYSIEDVRSVREGVFRARGHNILARAFHSLEALVRPNH